MRRLSLVFIVFVIFSSCNRSSGVKAILAVPDSAAINFYKSDGSMDTVVNVVILRDKKQLDELSGYIASGTSENINCGYDGSLHFFKNNIVIKDIDFRMNDAGCMHFSFSMDGKSFFTKLSAEAKQFLVSLSKK